MPDATTLVRQRCQLWCAIDTGSLDRARALVAAIAPHVDGLKLGMEFFCGAGIEGARAIGEATALPLFFDLKLHDIPNTVAGAMRSLRPLAPHYVTLHAAGGATMIRTVRDMAEENAAATGLPRTRILGVTVLTSMDQDDLNATGVPGRAADQVRRLAALAQAAGCDGIVASAQEIGLIRETCGPDIDIVTPGVRPAGAAVGDQKRLMTPREAAAAGATAVVVGRPITTAKDPAAAAAALAAELR